MDARSAVVARDVGNNIRSWRKLLGLTVQQVADRADISRQALSRLENGEPVSFETFLSVIRGLGLVDSLIEATDPWLTDLGRLRSQEELPKRVRHSD